MENNMENYMESVGIWGLKELSITPNSRHPNSIKQRPENNDLKAVLEKFKAPRT